MGSPRPKRCPNTFKQFEYPRRQQASWGKSVPVLEILAIWSQGAMDRDQPATKMRSPHTRRSVPVKGEIVVTSRPLNHFPTPMAIVDTILELTGNKSSGCRGKPKRARYLVSAIMREMCWPDVVSCRWTTARNKQPVRKLFAHAKHSSATLSSPEADAEAIGSRCPDQTCAQPSPCCTPP